MIKVREHLPDFIPGFKPEEAEISNPTELSTLNFIRKFKMRGYPNSKDFVGYRRSKLKFKDHILLIAQFYNDQRGNYHRVVAYLYCDPKGPAEIAIKMNVEEFKPCQ